MDNIKEKIKEIADPILKDYNLLLVDINIFTKGKGKKVAEVIIEKDDLSPATISDCEKISRELSLILDVEEIFSDAYILEVSSAGLDRPLVKKEDFARFKNRYGLIETKTPIVENRKSFKGVLLGLKEDLVIIETDDNKYEIEFDNITKAKLLINDDMIRDILRKKKQELKSKK